MKYDSGFLQVCLELGALSLALAIFTAQEPIGKWFLIPVFLSLAAGLRFIVEYTGTRRFILFVFRMIPEPWTMVLWSWTIVTLLGAGVVLTR